MMALLAKGYSLVLVSAVDFSTPFLRMLMLSHKLPLRELGFASALVATYSAFEMMTDFAIYRFVFSAPREKYEEALASAHALSIVRGTVVGAIAVAASPLVAAILSLQTHWPDFALLGLVILIRSFEHLGPRVAERDYRYGVQFRVSLIANTLGLMALATTLHFAPSEKAVLASLFAQMIGQVTASHALADTPYRLKFRSPLFLQAFRFGYPLMFNGFGMAASNQGDRFVVGAKLGLPTLGIYAIATLATIVPTLMVGRIVGTVLLAAFYNAARHSESLYRARLRLGARVVPIIAAIFSLGIVTLYNIVVPLVFGAKFALSTAGIGLLASGAFIRIARGEPFTTMLMNQGRTRRIAIINLSSSVSLPFEIILILVRPTIEAVLLGRLLGELFSAVVALYLTSDQFRAARHDYLMSVSVGSVGLGCGLLLALTTSVGIRIFPSLAALAVITSALALWTASLTRDLRRQGFPRQNSSVFEAGVG